jgi:hypothetical protein
MTAAAWPPASPNRTASRTPEMLTPTSRGPHRHRPGRPTADHQTLPELWWPRADEAIDVTPDCPPRTDNVIDFSAYRS